MSLRTSKSGSREAFERRRVARLRASPEDAPGGTSMAIYAGRLEGVVLRLTVCFSQLDQDRAPLDPAELAVALRPFGESRMLPRAAYTSEDVFAWEQRHFFSRGWTCVGRSQHVAQPGDQRAESIGSSGVLLTRSGDGALHAFANACRHRGHELLPCGESAHHGRIICPYHAWTYDLAGELKAAGGFKGTEGFDTDAHGLIELPASEWAGLVFVDGSGDAGPFTSQLGLLDELVSGYEAGRLLVAGRHEYEVAANWKILTENYHECYHCPMIHPQFCDISPPRSGENYAPDGGAWVGGWMDIRSDMATMSLDGKSTAVPLRGLDEEALHRVIYINVFPNVLLSFHPGLRDDPPARALGGGSDKDRVHVGVRPRITRQLILRPVLCR